VTLVGVKEIREEMEDYLQNPAKDAGNRFPADNSAATFEGKPCISLFLLLLLPGAAGTAYLVILHKKR
jgi:hypothetical protein